MSQVCQQRLPCPAAPGLSCRPQTSCPRTLLPPFQERSRGRQGHLLQHQELCPLPAEHVSRDRPSSVLTGCCIWCSPIDELSVACAQQEHRGPEPHHTVHCVQPAQPPQRHADPMGEHHHGRATSAEVRQRTADRTACVPSQERESLGC